MGWLSRFRHALLRCFRGLSTVLLYALHASLLCPEKRRSLAVGFHVRDDPDRSLR